MGVHITQRSSNMFNDKVQFNWEFFSDHVLKSYTSTYNDPTLADVTLVSDDNIAVSAHKLILSSSSPVLRKFFSSNSSSTPQCLFMFGLTNNVLRSILEFIYTGETMVKKEDLDIFLRAAKKLELYGVKTQESHLTQNDTNNLDNSFRAAQQELNTLIQKNSTPLDTRRNSAFEPRRSGSVSMESSSICIDDTEEGEVGADELLNMPQTQHPVSIPSQVRNTRGKMRKESFSCSICDRVFQYRSNLKSHVAIKHANPA